MEKHEEVYNNFWKGIVENEDGTINKDQLMRELSDFKAILSEVPKVYCEVANLSKPLTDSQVIIQGLYKHWVRRDDLLDDIELMSKDGLLTFENLEELIQS